jgi:hypothetical protein
VDELIGGETLSADVSVKSEAGDTVVRSLKLGVLA